jgi:hypothetical protein
MKYLFCFCAQRVIRFIVCAAMPLLFLNWLSAQELRLEQADDMHSGETGCIRLVLADPQGSYPGFNAQIAMPDVIETEESVITLVHGADLPGSFQLHSYEYDGILNVIGFSLEDSVGDGDGDDLELVLICFQLQGPDAFDSLPVNVEFELIGSSSGAVNPSALASETGGQSFAISGDQLTSAIGKALAQVHVSNLFQSHDGTGKTISIETIPEGLNFEVLYNGSTMPPSSAGLHTFTVSIVDAEYTGSASGTLSIEEDLDNDGIDDAWENLYFGHYTLCDPGIDSDLDGITNYGEFLFGLEPDKSESRLEVFHGELLEEQSFKALSFYPFKPSRNYIVYGSNDFQTWEPLSSDVYSLEGDRCTIDLTPEESIQYQFFQIQATRL